jgi:hypothetical protein
MVVCKFASKVMLFQKTLQYCEAIDNYYNRKTTIMISACVSHPFTWHVAQIVVNVFSHVVSACVLNQYCAHWFLSDAFHFAITMNTKLMEKLENALTFYNRLDEDFWMFNELTLASNMKKEVSIVFHSSHFFGRKYEQRKTRTCCP